MQYGVRQSTGMLMQRPHDKAEWEMIAPVTEVLKAWRERQPGKPKTTSAERMRALRARRRGET
jgi:hypothetical protein